MSHNILSISEAWHIFGTISSGPRIESCWTQTDRHRTSLPVKTVILLSLGMCCRTYHTQQQSAPVVPQRFACDKPHVKCI